MWEGCLPQYEYMTYMYGCPSLSFSRKLTGGLHTPTLCYTSYFNFLCTTPWISLLHFSFATPLSSPSLFLPPPPPLSLSKEETGGGQLTTCQTQSATGAEETAAAAAKEEEEKGREMVICRRNFETITSTHFICNFCVM